MSREIFDIEYFENPVNVICRKFILFFLFFFLEKREGTKILFFANELYCCFADIQREREKT